MTLTPKDVSIITQCAFKGAIDLTSADQLSTDEGVVTFTTRLAVLSEALLKQIELDIEAYATKPQRTELPPATPAKGQVRSVEQALENELGATAYVEIINDDACGDPIPPWALKKFAEAGTTRVYDNRHQLAENSSRPWFRDADDTKKAFWPTDKPKSGGARRTKAAA